MFKFLKNKHKRSDWMEGLIITEQICNRHGIGYAEKCNFWQSGYDVDNGRIDYINHKKYLESLDKETLT